MGRSDVSYSVLTTEEISFVLIAPFDDVERIIAKSEGAGLEIIGQALQSSGEGSTYYERGILSNILLPEGRQINAIFVDGMLHRYGKDDMRPALVRFAWRGYASDVDKKRIKETLEKALADLTYAEKTSSVELALGPVILACMRADWGGKRRRTLMRGMLFLYLMAVLVAGITWPIINYVSG